MFSYDLLKTNLITFLCVFLYFGTKVQCDTSDGGKAPRLQLNDGTTIPTFGLGTFLGFDEKGQKEVKEGEVEIPVTWALNAGYRFSRSDSEEECESIRSTAVKRKAAKPSKKDSSKLIDTAQLYLNEDQVGLAVRKSSVPREHIYIVTKLGSTKQRHAVEALRESLRLMNLSYVDLYLIHNPVAFTADGKYDIVDYVDTWKSMEEAKRLGLTKSIGVSNFNISQMERLMEHSEIKPSVLQVEVNLNLAQNKLVDYCKQHGVQVMAYTPFGSMFSKDAQGPVTKADDPTLVSIAQKYKKTTPQIVLRYLVQRGLIPIPKSTRKEKIEENIDIFDFELSADEMSTLSQFNKDYRTVFPSFWQDHPYYPFEKKDVADPDPFKGKN